MPNTTSDDTGKNVFVVNRPLIGLDGITKLVVKKCDACEVKFLKVTDERDGDKSLIWLISVTLN